MQTYSPFNFRFPIMSIHISLMMPPPCSFFPPPCSFFSSLFLWICCGAMELMLLDLPIYRLVWNRTLSHTLSPPTAHVWVRREREIEREKERGHCGSYDCLHSFSMSPHKLFHTHKLTHTLRRIVFIKSKMLNEHCGDSRQQCVQPCAWSCITFSFQMVCLCHLLIIHPSTLNKMPVSLTELPGWVRFMRSW